MRVMVTGGTGFIGSHTAFAMREAGHEVCCLVRDPVKLARVFAARGLPVPDHVVGEVVDRAAVRRALDGCDAVAHTAAVVTMKARRAREILEINGRGVENVVGGAVDAGVRSIVYVSSIGALFEPGGPPLSADSPVVPGSNAYAKSKSDAELYVRRLQQQGAPIHTTYPGAVVGPNDPGLSESNHALRTLARDVVFYTSGGFQMIDVRDLAAIHVTLAERPGGSGRSIAVAPFLSWREFAEALESVTGVRGLRVVVPGALLRLAGRIGDVVKRVWDFDFPLTTEGMIFATQFQGADGSLTAQELGVRYRRAEETLADTLRWMHAAGLIPARAVGRLARD